MSSRLLGEAAAWAVGTAGLYLVAVLLFRLIATDTPGVGRNDLVLWMPLALVAGFMARLDRERRKR